MKNKLSTTVILGSVMALGSISTAFAAAGLTNAQAEAIFAACQNAAAAEISPIRGGGKHTIMWCAVLNREGITKLIKATDTGESPKKDMDTDAWRASIEIAIAKAFTAVSVSSNDAALTSRQVGNASFLPPDNPGTLWGIGNTNLYRPLTGNKNLNPDDPTGKKHHGIVTFPGGVPVYDCESNKLVGGVGVSGDTVDADENVAEGAVTGAGFCLTP